jgi:hypothetical protein
MIAPNGKKVPVNSKFTINVDLGNASPETAAAFAANLGVGAKALKNQVSFFSISIQLTRECDLLTERRSRPNLLVAPPTRAR